MKSNRVKQALHQGQSQVGTWLSLCSPIAARVLARTGFSWLTVDLEHSPINWETASTIFSNIADLGGIPLARLPAGNHDHIKRALDGGAFGVVVPMVMDRAQAERCVAACKYPPVGNRSLGGSMHALNFQASPKDYYGRANDEILVVLQCEHIEAYKKADDIFSVPGIDAIFVGPNDLKASMRSADGSDPTPEAFEEALDGILKACQKHQVAAGLHCHSVEDVKKRMGQGWQFIALGSDLALLTNGATAACDALGQGPAESVAAY